MRNETALYSQPEILTASLNKQQTEIASIPLFLSAALVSDVLIFICIYLCVTIRFNTSHMILFSTCKSKLMPGGLHLP